MSKPAKTRKKRLNCKLVKTSLAETQQQSQKSKSPYLCIRQAQSILRGQVLPSKFKFREKQLDEIEGKIKQLLNASGPGRKKNQSKITTSSESMNSNPCKMIMITGSPGAGKTMCCNRILHKLQQQDYKVIFLNSNLLKKRSQIQSILAYELLGIENLQQKKLNTFKIMEELEKCKTKCILYIEQVQLFFNSHKEILSEDFFEIFTKKNLKVLLLGISNTIDALEKYGEKLNVKVSQVTNIVFNPYTKQQLMQIIKDKIDQVEKMTGIVIKFDDKLIRFVANKINQIKKGDMRIVFQFLKNLSSLIFPSELKTLQQAISQSQSPQCPQSLLQPEVTIEYVNKIFNSLRNIKSGLISTLPLNEQIILISMHNFFTQEQDYLFISGQQLRKKTKATFQALGLEPKRDMASQLEDLEVYGMVGIAGGKTKARGKGKVGDSDRYILKVSHGEIRGCFQGHPLLGKLL